MALKASLALHPFSRAKPPAGALPAAPEMELVGAAINLLPIPAAIVELKDDAVSLQVANRAFEVAGLGAVGRRSALIAQIDARITSFIQGESLRAEFALQFGAAVD